jgi:hypothetical protein
MWCMGCSTHRKIARVIHELSSVRRDHGEQLLGIGNHFPGFRETNA